MKPIGASQKKDRADPDGLQQEKIGTKGQKPCAFSRANADATVGATAAIAKNILYIVANFLDDSEAHDDITVLM